MGQRDYVADVNRIADRVETNVNAASSRADLAEAKRLLTTGIRELRAVKRDLSEEERQIRAAFQDARLDNQRSGQTLGLFMGSKGRGALARGRAAAARDLAERQARSLRPIADLKAAIDTVIGDYEQHKGRLADEMAHRREIISSTGLALTQPPQPTSPPPQWASDPTGRHEYRYWDGMQWTHHVADDGEASVDPRPITDVNG